MATVETRAVRIKGIFKSDLFIAGGGALILLWFLLVNLAPIIYAADSAIFTAASYYLSTAFPPGYPLLITIGKLFTFLPAGSIAYRTNLADAVPACAAFMFVFWLSRRLGVSKALALSAAFLSALLPLTFSESLKAEVFTLNSAFCLLVLWLGLQALEKEDARYVYAAAFLFGLGTGNHHTLALLLLPVAYPALKLIFKKPAIILYSVIFLVAGSFINLHIVLRSIVLKDSGFIFSIADTFARLPFIFLRETYSTSSLQSLQYIGGGGAAGLSMWWQGFWNLVKYVITANYGPVAAGVLLTVAALLFFIKNKQDRYLLLAVAPWIFILPRMTLTGTIQSEKNIEEVRRYYVPLLYILCVIFAMQASRLYFFLKKSGLRTVSAAGVLLIVPVFYIPSDLRHSASGNYLAYDRARDSLSVMPPESVYILYGDNPAFGDYYIQWVERYREDILAFTKDPRADRYSARGSSILCLNGDIFSFVKQEGNNLVVKRAALDDKAGEGKFFVPIGNALLNQFKGRYRIEKYGPLSYMAVFNGNPPVKKLDDFIIKNTRKLNFERSASAPNGIFLSNEIKNLYGFSLLTDLSLKNPGPEDAALGKDALRLVDPENFLPYFINVLARKQNGNPLLFLRWTEQNFSGTKMADMAHVLEYVMLSEAGSNEAAAKYSYLVKNGLLVYLDNIKTLYDKTMKDAGISIRMASSSGRT
ncbi:MAG: DUF2723 domain-containing protein [Actinomycetota bacterium]|nr:DUF2723 domain-containing protein [Actinomycetota bacterium]